MAINDSAFNSHAINASAGIAPTDTFRGNTALLLPQTIVGYQGATGLRFMQTVSAIGHTVLALDQTVVYPAGDVTLSFEQSINQHGNTAVTFAQNIFNPVAVAGSWRNWDVLLMVDGVDISDSLMDTAPIEVDIERNSAGIASFSLKLSGLVDALTWVGKSVTIDYLQDSGASWRLFTGIITNPVLNLTNSTLQCTCSDDLQRIVDNHSNEQLNALAIGARWSKYVFDQAAIGWSYLQDLVSTAAVSVEMDSMGSLQSNSWKNKVVADFSFDEYSILDGSLSVDLVQRTDLVNQVDITFSSRFERLYHREEYLRWDWPVTFCDSEARFTLRPSKTMVREAVAAAGWQILAENFICDWPTKFYHCFGQTIGWINNYPEAVRGFVLHCAFRWQQSITNEFKISVKAPASITAYRGAFVSTLNSAADFKADIEDWGLAETDFSQRPAGFVLDDQHNYYRDDADMPAQQQALDTMIAVAIERINATHRTNKANFSLPLAPYLSLSHTLRVDDGNEIKGVVNRLKHTLNLTSAEAITAVSLAISSGQSGLDITTQTFTSPEHPALPGGSSPTGNYVDVPLHVGGLEDSPAFNEDFWGILTNYTIPAAGSHEYPREVRLKFPAIPDEKTQNQTVSIPYEINIAVPHNSLIITA